MNHSDYAAYDAVGLAALVAAGEVSADELMDAARARAEAVNPRINAIVRDVEPPAGTNSSPPAAFAGVPFLLKDLFQDIAGEVTANGCRALAGVRAPVTSTIVQRWTDAGLRVFGKTSTPEFGAKGITEPELFGPCRNPWDTDRTPGGSSGGAAAVVAAEVVPAASASDGGGSIRIPAACCGLFGLKAGRGLIPAGPAVGEGLFGSAASGVISRSVRDTAALLDVVLGADPAAPYAPAVPDRPLAEEVGAGWVGPPLRIGVALDPVPDADGRAAVAAAVAVLEDLGHHVEEVAAPYDHKPLARDFLASWFVNAAVLVNRIKAATGAGDEGFERDTLLMAAMGRATSSVDAYAAIDARQAHVQRLAAFHREWDLLLTPTLATAPPRIGQFDSPAPVRLAGQAVLRARAGAVLPRLGVVDRMIDDNLGWIPYTQLANLTGRPAMSVPLHWTPAGLPLGVQFVGPLRGEAMLVRLAAQLEQARPWADRRPGGASAWVQSAPRLR